MIVVAAFSLGAILHLAAATDQTPKVTQCPGQNNSVVEIQSVVVSGAKLGKKLKFEGTFVVKEVTGKHPVLQLSFSKPDGKKLPCDPSILPCKLNLCDGTTKQEKKMNKDWGNTCPVQPGTYSARLSFRLPKGPEAEALFGDGNIIVKFNIVTGIKFLDARLSPWLLTLTRRHKNE
uniref:Putative lipocalin-8 1 n=1 Tax=Amblyomma triste TaxID=251400 RepID=A0A023GA33_AMBTT